MRNIRNCTVAVVGAAGFIGSHLVDHLINDRECEVLAIDNLVAGRRDFLHSGAIFRHADITGSEEYLRQLFKEFNVKFCFNLAAWPYIVDSFSRPLHVFNVNATGAIKVINAAHEAGCEGVAQWSSAELYGQISNKPIEGKPLITEEDAVCPHSTYGAAKAAVDYYCQCAWRERRTPVLGVRQFNVCGERDVLHPYILVEVYRQLRDHFRRGVTDKAVLQLGNNSERDLQYVGDSVHIATELLEKGNFGEVYNTGSGTSIKIYDLAKMVGSLMGFKEVTIERDESRVRPWEIWYLRADTSKLYSVISYRPKVELQEAVARTIGWLRGNDHLLV